MQNILDNCDSGGQNEQRDDRQREVVEGASVVLPMRHFAAIFTLFLRTSALEAC